MSYGPVKIGAMTLPTKEELIEIVNLWHLSKVHSYDRYKRSLWVSDKFSEAHPERSHTWVYKTLERQLAGTLQNPARRRLPDYDNSVLYEKASSAGADAADRSMKKAGRSKWNEEDYNVMVETFNKVYPLKNPKEKLLPMKSRPGYQNIDRPYLKKLGLSQEKIDRLVARQLSGMTLAEAYRKEQQNPKKKILIMGSNPPAVKIYSQCIEIRASKAGMPHKCDAACARSGHLYKHAFKKRCCVYGLPDGSILIK